MYIYKAPNANGTKIAVTATAANIFDLINTAASTDTAYAGYPSRANGIMLQPEDGDIRVLFDGNTPSATVGFLVKQGCVATFANVPLTKLKLIRTGGTNVAVCLQIGLCDEGESSTFGVSSAASSVTISGSLPAGTNNIGDVDVLSLPALPTGTNTIGKVNLSPSTADGLTPSKTISAASTNATSLKGSAGKVHMIYASNINAAVRYLKLYNKASAPTVGTDTPVSTLAIPGNTEGRGFIISSELGAEFATGIAFALTTGVADSDTGAVAANELVVNIWYK